MYSQALWIEAFYLQPPTEKLKAMLWESYISRESSLTEKQHTINHIIISNDSVIKFNQCSI